MATIAEALKVAVEHHQSGRLREAEQIYRQILAADAQHADSWQLLGVIAAQTGQPQQAVELIGKAIAIQPNRAELHNNLGESHRVLGRLNDALQCYERAINLKPQYCEGWYNRGNALNALRRPAEAAESFRRAAEIKPDYAHAWNNLGTTLQNLGRLEEAIAALREAVRIKPDYALAHNNLGTALVAAGRKEEAVQSYRQALMVDPKLASANYNYANWLHETAKDEESLVYYSRAIQADPQNALSYNNMGTALQTLGRVREAEQCYRQALQLNPEYYEAHYNLGHVMLGQRRSQEAVASFRETIRIKPDYASAFCDLGVALRDLGNLPEALRALDQSVAINPNLAEAHCNRGVVLHELHRAAEALPAMQTSLRLRPENPATHNNMGNILKDLNRLDDAAACYEAALKISPDFVVAYSNLGAIMRGQGRLDDSIRLFERAISYHEYDTIPPDKLTPEQLAQRPQRKPGQAPPSYAEIYSNLGNSLMDKSQLAEAAVRYRQALAIRADFPAVHSNLLFCLVHDPAIPPAELFAEHEAFGRRHAPPLPNPPQHANVRDVNKRLKIGYVSCDLRFHAVTRFFEPLLIHHDPAAVEVFCYSQSKQIDTTTERLKKLSHHWRNSGALTDREFAELVRQDGIDILVDLSGHTAGNRLAAFGLKPAPVQVTYMGYPFTTGLRAIDYRFTDAVLDPPGSEQFNTEKLVRLPRGAACFAARQGTPEVAPLPALTNGYITFGSLHRLSKFNPGVFDAWSQVLHQVPTSRLFLFRDTLIGSTRDSIAQEFVRRGIPLERLELRSNANAGYMTAFHEIDVGLDTFPYNGGTISYESLWMGVPYVTMRGDRPPARGGESILKSVGLGHLVADTPEQFVSMAVGLASDVDALVKLRAELRQKVATTVGDCVGFTRDLEAEYRRMWTDWCAGK